MSCAPPSLNISPAVLAALRQRRAARPAGPQAPPEQNFPMEEKNEPAESTNTPAPVAVVAAAVLSTISPPCSRVDLPSPLRHAVSRAAQRPAKSQEIQQNKENQENTKNAQNKEITSNPVNPNDSLLNSLRLEVSSLSRHVAALEAQAENLQSALEESQRALEQEQRQVAMMTSEQRRTKNGDKFHEDSTQFTIGHLENLLAFERLQVARLTGDLANQREENEILSRQARVARAEKGLWENQRAEDSQKFADLLEALEEESRNLEETRRALQQAQQDGEWRESKFRTLVNGLREEIRSLRESRQTLQEDQAKATARLGQDLLAQAAAVQKETTGAISGLLAKVGDTLKSTAAQQTLNQSKEFRLVEDFSSSHQIAKAPKRSQKAAERVVENSHDLTLSLSPIALGKNNEINQPMEEIVEPIKKRKLFVKENFPQPAADKENENPAIINNNNSLNNSVNLSVKPKLVSYSHGLLANPGLPNAQPLSRLALGLTKGSGSAFMQFLNNQGAKAPKLKS